MQFEPHMNMYTLPWAITGTCERLRRKRVRGDLIDLPWSVDRRVTHGSNCYVNLDTICYRKSLNLEFASNVSKGSNIAI